MKWLINHLENGFSGFSIFEWVIQNRDFSIIRVSTLRQPFIHESVWLIISYLEAKHLLKYFSPDEVPKGPTRTISERMKISELYILNVKQKFQIQNGDAITFTSGALEKMSENYPTGLPMGVKRGDLPATVDKCKIIYLKNN